MATESKEMYRQSSDGYSEEDSAEEAQPFIHDFKIRSSRKSNNYLLFGCLTALLLSNLGWYALYATKKSTDPIDVSLSSSTMLKSLHWDTPYSGSNKTETNQLWRDLFPPGEGLVFLSNSEAKSRRLPASVAHSGNASESTYFVAAYHQIHCLSVIRGALYHFEEKVAQTVPIEHTLHCLDSLRQEVMCHADSDLLYTDDGKVFGDGQVRQCRDWNALRAWTVQHHI